MAVLSTQANSPIDQHVTEGKQSENSIHLYFSSTKKESLRDTKTSATF